MPNSQHDYGPVNRIESEAFGQPGKRTFRVIVANEHRAASLWMEKEQLAALGRAIETQLGRLRAARSARNAAAPDPERAYRGEPELDFRVAQLALGYDEQESAFLLLAYTPEDEDPDNPTFSCQATIAQFRALAEQIQRVVAAGRPICPLCSLPIDPEGHPCARTNGHLKQAIPPLDDDDTD
jgi:uncharacterized repeat protein (TIGR03847 family)